MHKEPQSPREIQFEEPLSLGKTQSQEPEEKLADSDDSSAGATFWSFFKGAMNGLGTFAAIEGLFKEALDVEGGAKVWILLLAGFLAVANTLVNFYLSHRSYNETLKKIRKSDKRVKTRVALLFALWSAFVVLMLGRRGFIDIYQLANDTASTKPPLWVLISSWVLLGFAMPGEAAPLALGLIDFKVEAAKESWHDSSLAAKISYIFAFLGVAFMMFASVPSIAEAFSVGEGAAFIMAGFAIPAYYSFFPIAIYRADKYFRANCPCCKPRREREPLMQKQSHTGMSLRKKIFGGPTALFFNPSANAGIAGFGAKVFFESDDGIKVDDVALRWFLICLIGLTGYGISFSAGMFALGVTTKKKERLDEENQVEGYGSAKLVPEGQIQRL